MRVLIASERPGDRKLIRDALKKIPFTDFDSTFALNISEEAPSQGSIVLVLSDHPKGHFYDLIIADNEIKRGTGLELLTMLGEKELNPSIPFIIYGDRATEKANGARMPKTAFVINQPVTAQTLRETLTAINTLLVNEEDGRRKGRIEQLMQTLAAGKKTVNFPSLLESIYIESAAKVLHYKKYAPWHYLTYLSLARIYMGCNKFDSMIPCAKAATKLNPECDEAHRLLVLGYKKTGKSREELDELKVMLSTDPASAFILLKIGEAYLHEGDFRTAETYFLNAISSYNPDDENRLRAKLHVGLGKAYAREGEATGDNGRLEQATGEFKKAIEIYPLLMAAYNDLIIVYKKLGRYEEARDIMALAIDITPDNAEDWVSLFEVYLIDGETEKARFSLQKALKYDPENQITLCTAAEIYVRQGMFGEAITLFEKAAEVNPSDPRLYNFLGICSRQLDRHELAVGYYQKALRLNPDDPGLHFNLATAYRHMGNTALARRSYQSALKFDPDFREVKEALEALDGRY
ncbi:MAG: tetratricopeptide repeat protein [Nitrospinae bacterium]|nr:tetratricopeptide repeat protein [Nitrospinota bacterium]